MHDTADNTNTLLWAPSVAQRTSYETSIDNAHIQLIGPLISRRSSSYTHIQFQVFSVPPLPSRASSHHL